MKEVFKKKPAATGAWNLLLVIPSNTGYDYTNEEGVFTWLSEVELTRSRFVREKKGFGSEIWARRAFHDMYSHAWQDIES